MKKVLTLLYLLISFNSFSQKNIVFDDGWKFYKGGVLGGQNIDFDDSNWRNVDLPHKPENDKTFFS